jgi:hypothetical protein
MAKPQTYHQRAQAFIQSAKAKGYNVTAENGELIAHPPGTPGYVKPKPVAKPSNTPNMDALKARGGVVSKQNSDMARHLDAVRKNKSFGGKGWGGP